MPFPVISAAANGDTNAMCAILKHYEGYIAKLCTRTLKDDAGNTYSYVDEEMRNRLQGRLITRTLAKRAAREVPFSDLSESELAQLFTTDEYKSDYFRFQVSGFDVLVKNELLAEVLNALPERKGDIVRLSYFLDMSDAEIAELLNVVRTTVFRHRKSALAKIKQYLEGKAEDRKSTRLNSSHVALSRMPSSA